MRVSRHVAPWWLAFGLLACDDATNVSTPKSDTGTGGSFGGSSGTLDASVGGGGGAGGQGSGGLGTGGEANGGLRGDVREGRYGSAERGVDQGVQPWPAVGREAPALCPVV